MSSVAAKILMGTLAPIWGISIFAFESNPASQAGTFRNTLRVRPGGERNGSVTFASAFRYREAVPCRRPEVGRPRPVPFAG